MTTPVASGTLYATVADLRNVMSGTDSGTGTAAQLTGWELAAPRQAASWRTSSASMPGAGSMAVSVRSPVVSVPVLSNTTLVTSARFSRNAVPLIRMPWRPATAMPAMAVAGAASTSAQGQEATSTASVAAVSPLANQVPPAIMSTSTMYWPA